MAFDDNLVLRATPIDNDWEDVAWSPELELYCAVAVNGTNRCMTSPDGINWTVRGIEALGWEEVVWAAELGIFCVAGSSGGLSKSIATSPDGINWTTRTTPNHEYRSVAWSADQALFCAVGDSGESSTSPDGITWTPRSLFDANTHGAVGYSPALDLWVSVTNVGGVNPIRTSADAITWITATSDDFRGKKVIWVDDLSLFVAIGRSLNPDNHLYTSSDGVTWTAREMPGEFYQGVAYSSELRLFLAVGEQSSFNAAYSYDGISWFNKASTPNRTWDGVTYSPTLCKFVSVSASGTGARVMTWDFNGNDVLLEEGIVSDRFVAQSSSIETGEFLGRATLDSTTARVPAMFDVPCLITVHAEQGEPRVDSATYAVGDFLYPKDPQAIPYCFKVISISTGISGSSAPTYPTTVGGTVVDGGITLENVWGLVEPVTNGPFIPNSL